MEETIAACSTPVPGAVAVIRISGGRARELLEKCFESKSPIEERKQRYGILRAGTVRDTAMAVFFKAPKSYTGEDTVEIYTHGSRAVVEQTLKFLTENGARPATGGEFTRRAYLNGKLDLSAAEGIVNLINSETEKEANAAFSMLNGGLKAEIEGLQRQIQTAAAAAEAAIDYPEEGIEEETKEQMQAKISLMNSKLDKLKNSYNSGRLIKNGVKVALTGRVNAGKSQLANSLLNKDMAIVTDIPGTTRDTLKDFYEYKGYRFIVTDTAGIRETADKVEKIGIDRAVRAVIESDIILAVFESGEEFDWEIIRLIKEKTGNNLDGKNIIFVENKIDLEGNEEKAGKLFEKSFPAPFQKLLNFGIEEKEETQWLLRVSALKNIGIEELKEEILLKAQIADDDGIILTEMRHFNAVCRAKSALDDALVSLKTATMDCIAADLLSAYNSLGEITGVIGTDEIINEVFSNFCVGK